MNEQDEYCINHTLLLFFTIFLESTSSFDLVYLIDTSDATTSQQLDEIIKLIRVQTSAYSFGDKARVALVTYGATPFTILNLKDGITNGDVLKGLYSIQKVSGEPDLPKALEYVQNNIIKMARRDRPTILSVFTSKNPSVTEEKQLKLVKDELEKRKVKTVVTTLDKAGMTEPLTSIVNVDRGYVVPEDKDDLVSVLPESTDAIDRALGKCQLISLLGIKYSEKNIYK